MSRGIVVGHQVNTEDLLFISGAINNQDILKWLLYWDKITFAGIGRRGGSISGARPQDIIFLEDAGIFDTKIVDLDNDIGSTVVPAPIEGTSRVYGLAANQFVVAEAAARIYLSKKLSAETGDIWTIGQSGGEKLLLPGTANNETKELIDIKLVNCLPVPKAITSFEDILEFKHRYQDELDELRVALDGLRENILSSSDERRATNAAMHHVSKSILNIRLSLEGRGIQSHSETISLYTENPSIGFWSSMGGVTAAATGFPVEVGLSAGIALPTMFKFVQRSIVGGQNFPTDNSDFAYAYESIRQFG